LPALSDPTAIVTAGLASTESARTVHLDVEVDGEINLDVFGGEGTSINLGGTSASADVDMAGGKAHVTFAAPGLLILSGELIQIGETSYLRTSLGGPQFETIEAIDALPVDPTDPSGVFDGLGGLLLADGVHPVKGPDAPCGDTSCYTVTIELTADELAALGASAPIPDDLPMPLDLPDLAGVELAMTVRVEKDTHRLAGIGTVLSLGEIGSVTVDVTATNWDQPMDISPPPADQVKPAT
jgi:hypothetical protein